MWAGLYLIAFSLLFIGSKIDYNCETCKKTKHISIKIDGNIIGKIGFYSIFVITIAYGINLIINS